ncbi:hypothetical protein AB0O28_26570 [Microbispora sp. NPDC088329]|uniref:hypothetical protein n=1 Tax=Microbispora sp. NPDC088329 TaxID=3154869 RepID=UPI003427B2FE
MHRKSRQPALAAIAASTFAAGAVALLGGTASAATGVPGSAWASQAGEPGGSVRATSYTTTISEPLLVTESVPGARMLSAPLITAPVITESLPIQAPQLTVSMPRMSVAELPQTVSVMVGQEFPAQWSARHHSGSSLRSEAFPARGMSMEQTAEEARQSIRDEASSAKQQIMQQATNAQQRIEQMSQRAQQQLSEAQSQSPSLSQSQSSSLPESALGNAPESGPPAAIPPTLGESSSSYSSEACQ